MIQKNEPLSSKDFKKGLVTRSDILTPDPEQSPNCMDMKWYFDGAIGKRAGASTTNSVTIGSTAVASWVIDSNGTLSTSLISYWKLEEASNTRSDAVDGNNLADINSTGTIVGIRGQAALFTATASNGLLGGNPTNLQTGNINFSVSSWIYLNSTSPTLQRSIISKKDPEIDATTVLLLHCDGTNGSTSFPDSSASNKTITANGNAKVDTSQSEFGGASANFDGTNSYLSVPTSSDFNFTTGDFTIDFWVRFNSIASFPQTFVSRNNFSTMRLQMDDANHIAFFLMGLDAFGGSIAWTPAANTWYHIAVTRQSGSMRLFINGTQTGPTNTDNTNVSDTTPILIGQTASVNWFNGWIDEFRIINQVAVYTTNFTPPAKAYGVQEFEYWLYVNTNNQATFRVSSTGTNQTATVQASSIGALNTSTWYNVIAWHSNNSHIGISVNLSVNTTLYTNGLRVGAAPFLLGANSSNFTAQATTFMDGRIDETAFWTKILSSQERSDLYGGGSGNTYTGAASAFGWAMFDFGATNIRWLTVAQGSGLVASSNLGTTFVNIASSRTQTYQYLDRSKNILIATSDAYDVPLYWAGSATTFAATLAPGSAPSVKYSINYQGFLILLNSQTRPRGFFYADENLQLTDPWTNSFDLPSSADDETTAAFVLSKFLYVSTRYRLFFVSFVGGNPDWAYRKIKDWGFVPRTVKIATVKGSQVAVGMDWQRRIRVFDGYDDLFISDSVENNNGVCDFATSKISFAGSGLTISHAEVDQVEQEYRLNVAIGAGSTQTTHAIVLNLRTLALYPYSNQNYQAMCRAESNNQLHLMAVDRSGFVHILNSGNMDVTKPISEVYDSPVLFKGLPAVVQKSQQNNLYFKVDSCGTIYYQDALNRSTAFSTIRQLVNLQGTEPVLQVEAPIDIPATYNTYQFRLISSGGTANPWKMSRWDFLQDQKGIGKG